MACNGSTVEPSEISAKAKRFCFRTDRMNPLTLTSLSSNVHGPSALLAWRICAHRRAAIRECGVELEPSLATDVAKVRRHVCMAESRTLLGKWNDRRSTLAGGLGKPRSFDSAVPITALLNILRWSQAQPDYSQRWGHPSSSRKNQEWQGCAQASRGISLYLLPKRSNLSRIP